VTADELQQIKQKYLLEEGVRLVTRRDKKRETLENLSYGALKTTDLVQMSRTIAQTIEDNNQGDTDLFSIKAPTQRKSAQSVSYTPGMRQNVVQVIELSRPVDKSLPNEGIVKPSQELIMKRRRAGGSAGGGWRRRCAFEAQTGLF